VLRVRVKGRHWPMSETGHNQPQEVDSDSSRSMTLSTWKESARLEQSTTS